MADLTIHKERIANAIEQDGPYTHNLIGMVLNDVAKKVGIPEANDLIDEFDLEDYGFVKAEK